MSKISNLSPSHCVLLSRSKCTKTRFRPALWHRPRRGNLRRCYGRRPQHSSPSVSQSRRLRRRFLGPSNKNSWLSYDLRGSDLRKCLGAPDCCVKAKSITPVFPQKVRNKLTTSPSTGNLRGNVCMYFGRYASGETKKTFASVLTMCLCTCAEAAVFLMSADKPWMSARLHPSFPS